MTVYSPWLGDESASSVRGLDFISKVSKVFSFLVQAAQLLRNFIEVIIDTLIIVNSMKNTRFMFSISRILFRNLLSMAPSLQLMDLNVL